VFEKSRERLSVSKRAIKKFVIGRAYVKTLNDVEDKATSHPKT
jgi:hypothetical protein